MNILHLVQTIREHMDWEALRDARRRELVFDWSVSNFFDDQARVERGRSQLPSISARAANVVIACGRHRICFLGKVVGLDFEYGPPLKKRMKAEHWSVATLAERANVSDSTIKRVRASADEARGTSRPRYSPQFDVVVKIGRAFSDGLDFIYDRNAYAHLVNGSEAEAELPQIGEGTARMAAVLRRLLEDTERRARVSAEFDVAPSVLDAWVANIAPELEGLVRSVAERDRELRRLVDP